MAIRFFHSTSYSTHPYSDVNNVPEDQADFQPIGVRAYVEQHRGIAFSPDFDIADIFNVRDDLACSVKFYGARLNKLDPVSFYYLNKSQRIACEEELLYTFYITSAEYQLSLFEGENHRAKKRAKQLQRCANLLNTLRNTPGLNEKKSPEQGHQELVDDSEKPAAYVALKIIAPIIGETMLSFTAAEWFRSVKKIMTDANFYRLNWVWGGGLDRIVLDLMPSGVGRSEQASEVFSDISPVTGYMSWVLYYLRLGIELYLLSKHTLKGSWMDPWASDEDKAVNIGVWERFQTQWALRKFSILNDAFWATANLACFFWLVGSGTLGYMGDALTGVLLIFDLSLVTWGHLEDKTDYLSTMSKYTEDIEILRLKREAEPDKLKKKVLQEHINVLVEAREQCEFEWIYTEKQWMHDWWYALGLFAAFSMLCCFFIPPSALLPATALILGVVGAGLSFLMTIGSHALATSTEIEQLEAASIRDKERCDRLQTKLDQLKAENTPGSTSAIKKLEIDIQHRTDDLNYQKQMIAYHQTEIIQQTLSEALVPATALAILVFLPLTYALLVLIPTVALLMMSGQLLGLNKPQEPDSPDDTLLEAPPSP